MDGTLQPKAFDVPLLRLAGDVVQRLADAPFVVRIALLFVGVVGLVAAFPARPATHRLSNAELVVTPAPFVACGIDRAFDASADRCLPRQAAPQPCMQTARGVCMPTTATMPTAAPEPAPAAAVQQPADPFAGVMGITKDH